MKYPDLNSDNSYLFTLEWRKYFWVFDLFGSFISFRHLFVNYHKLWIITLCVVCHTNMEQIAVCENDKCYVWASFLWNQDMKIKISVFTNSIINAQWSLQVKKPLIFRLWSLAELSFLIFAISANQADCIHSNEVVLGGFQDQIAKMW